MQERSLLVDCANQLLQLGNTWCRGGPHSSLMFCTNGVLLRMLTSGDGLEGVTHIVVDEIHERDKFADFLLIMLRDLLPSKPHLHLLLMSATLNVELFTDYFDGCPLLQVPGYTYPVQVLQCYRFHCDSCTDSSHALCKVELL